MSHQRPTRDFHQTRARRKLALGAANGRLQGGAAAPKKILAGGSLEAVVCHAGSQAAGMASAAYPTNSTTAKRLRGVRRPQADRTADLVHGQLIPDPAKSFISPDPHGLVGPLSHRSTPWFDFRRVFRPRDKNNTPKTKSVDLGTGVWRGSKSL